jgi:hypothetical protein
MGIDERRKHLHALSCVSVYGLVLYRHIVLSIFPICGDCPIESSLAIAGHHPLSDELSSNGEVLPKARTVENVLGELALVVVRGLDSFVDVSYSQSSRISGPLNERV